MQIGDRVRVVKIDSENGQSEKAYKYLYGEGTIFYASKTETYDWVVGVPMTNGKVEVCPFKESELELV